MDPKTLAESKELSLSEQEYKIRNAFMKKFGPDDSAVIPADPDEMMWPIQIYGDHLVFRKGDRFYSLDFAKTKAEIVFGADAVEVEPSWAPVPETKETMMKDGAPASCFLVVEDPKKSTSWHLQVKDPDGKPNHTLMGAAWAALHEGYRGNKYAGPNKAEALAKLTALYKAEKMPLPSSKSFSAYKDAGGAWRWVAISGSAFRDRDGEIVTAKALAGAVDRADARSDQPDYGPLRWWHVGGWEFPDGIEKWETWKAGPGLDLGTCDFSMVFGNMLIESGTFKSAEIGEAINEVADTLGLSICFSHPLDEPKEKSFDNINLLERSLLPDAFASNLLTKLSMAKGESEMDIKKKLDALAAILKGKPDLKEQILSDAAAIEKAAKDAGLEFKEVQEMIAAPDSNEVVPPTETSTPVVPPAEEAPAAEPPVAEETISGWTPAKLQTFIAQAIEGAQKSAAEQAATKEASRDNILNDTVKALTALTGRMTALESTAQATQQKLDTLADARPPRVKEIASNRPTAKEENVTSTPTEGPRIDPGFMDFARGGK